jgi:hypothetical protein
MVPCFTLYTNVGLWRPVDEIDSGEVALATTVVDVVGETRCVPGSTTRGCTTPTGIMRKASVALSSN